MNISQEAKEKIDVWVNDFVVIMNGSTFSDNNSYKEKLTNLAETYIRYAYEKGLTDKYYENKTN
jgi:uncharacterized Fe-S cluster-containing radical SAM superfamily protein